MSEYYALVKWTRGKDEPYIDNEYSRGHVWEFHGGLGVGSFVITSCCTSTSIQSKQIVIPEESILVFAFVLKLPYASFSYQSLPKKGM